MSYAHAITRPFMNTPVAFQAAVLMVIGTLFLSILNGLIRHMADTGMHVFEIVFLRNLAGLLAIAPWILRNGFSVMKTNRPGLFVTRGVSGFIAMLAWFFAVSAIPLADAVALNFTAPLFGTLLAIVVLKEVVRVRRWVAILVGFAGAMIILRPGTIEMSIGAYAAIFSAAAMASSIIFVKMLSRTESTPAIVAWTQIIILPMSFIPALFVWQTPNLHQLMMVVCMGIVATVGHLFFTRAFALGETTFVLPFDFFRLIFSAAIGFLFFSQSPDMYVWIGAAVIFAAAFYIALREVKVARDEARSATIKPAEAAVAKLDQSQ